MKKLLKISAIITLLATNAFANDAVDTEIAKIQKDWAIVKYKSQDNDQRIEGYRRCVNIADKLLERFENSPKLMVWKGICLASEAELTKLSALGKVKKAKKIFEDAAKIDEKVLDGSAYTNLGVLYHRVPGWPIGFGDNDKAEENFKKVLEISPGSIDGNYFYALFLADVKDDYEGALKHLRIAAQAPSRNRPLADSERKKEIAKKIAEFEEELK